MQFDAARISHLAMTADKKRLAVAFVVAAIRMLCPFGWPLRYPFNGALIL